nr:hypothetical protein [uncultured bacterium]
MAGKNPAECFAEQCRLVEPGRKFYKTYALHTRIVCHHCDVSGVGRRLTWLAAIFTPCRCVKHGHFYGESVNRR